MVFYVPVEFVFDSVEAVSDDSVVGFVISYEFMNERNDNREAATDKNSHNFRSHDTTVPVGMGFRLLLLRLLRATQVP
jgi:hypothetical protein